MTTPCQSHIPSRLTTLLTLPLLLFVCSCTPKQKKPTQDFQRLTPRILSADESFNLIWAEIIARTDAINMAAKAIINTENLEPGAKFPPNQLGITNTPENNSPGEKPYDTILEARINNNTYTFWIHIENTVPEQGVTTAIACAIKRSPKEYYYYPKTTGTQALMDLSLNRMRNDLTQLFIFQWQAREKKSTDTSQIMQVNNPYPEVKPKEKHAETNNTP